MRTDSLRRIIIVAAAVVALPATLHADVYGYAVSKSIGYSQTSNAQPAGPDSWLFIAGLFSETDGEVLSAALRFDMPPVTTFDLYEATPTAQFYYSPQFATEAELDAAYPATTYTLAALRAGGEESGAVELPAGLYPPEIPYFTGDTYDRLQAYDISQPFDGGVNAFVPTGGTNASFTFISVVEEGVGPAFGVSLTAAESTFQIPAGTLLPDTDYSIGVMHLNAVQTPDAGFGAAMASAEYSRGTIVYFTTRPPQTLHRGDMNCDGLVNNFDIDPFVLALVDAPTWQLQFPDCPLLNGDINADEAFNNFDIDPFVVCIISGCT